MSEAQYFYIIKKKFEIMIIEKFQGFIGINKL